MKTDKKYRGTHNEFPLRDDMALTGTVSTTDCTGMIPSGSVDSAEEYDETNDLHKYSPASGKNTRLK